MLQMFNPLNLLVFLFTLVILVIIHELGHFLMAKKFNVKVLEFGFGLPPRAWGKKFGETLFSINWLPLGGFVKLLGEDETDSTVLKNDRSFASQSPYKKMGIVVAGVIMNTFLAWFLIYIILIMQNFKVTLPPMPIDYTYVGAYQTENRGIFVSEVSPDSPASQANLNRGDLIVGVNNKPITDTANFVSDIKNSTGQEIILNISNVTRTDEKQVKITPRKDPPANQGALGVSLATFKQVSVEYRDWWQKLFAGPLHGYNLTVSSLQALGTAISYSFQQRDLDSLPVAGLIGMVAIQDTILKQDLGNVFLAYLEFVAMLSLSLAIFNILPFPALDGGRLVFYIFEALTGRKANPHFEKYTHALGMALLFTLLFLIIYLDIKRFILQ